LLADYGTAESLYFLPLLIECHGYLSGPVRIMRAQALRLGGSCCVQLGHVHLKLGSVGIEM